MFNTPLVLHVLKSDRYKLDKDFSFSVLEDKKETKTFVVPTGFISDLASVPRLPFAYLVVGGIGHEAAVAHDYLYSECSIKKSYADKVFYEGLRTLNIGLIRRQLMYRAVQLFGSKGEC